jgi:hypothetical protein
MRLLIRILQRLAILGLGLLTVWLVAFVFFDFADQKLPWALAVGATYGFAAYIVFPYSVRMGLKILHRRRVPQYTITADGLPGDPVNLALVGTFEQLRAAFSAAGWVQADRLAAVSSWRMVRAFVFNKPYPTAPFSTLYLFGRAQDVGFEQAIDDSPRKRHHIRFWGKSLVQAPSGIDSATFWNNTDRPVGDERAIWVGAGTKDTGFSLTRLTFQITHATASDTNAERTFVIAALSGCGVIGNATLYKPGDRLITEHVNHYVTDGEVAMADLVEQRQRTFSESPSAKMTLQDGNSRVS